MKADGRPTAQLALRMQLAMQDADGDLHAGYQLCSTAAATSSSCEIVPATSTACEIVPATSTACEIVPAQRWLWLCEETPEGG
jgi:hypothetical protein